MSGSKRAGPRTLCRACWHSRDAPRQVARRVQVEQLVERVLQLHGSTLNKKHIAFEFKPTPDLPPVQGDASLLLQVFLNLVINAEQAISAVRDSGKIQITAIRLDSNVVVTFDDDGPGIPPEILSRVFDPFFTTKRPGGGTGLGLTISMAIIREHGGTHRSAFRARARRLDQNDLAGGAAQSFSRWVPRTRRRTQPEHGKLCPACKGTRCW